jgi:hypothetical protein
MGSDAVTKIPSFIKIGLGIQNYSGVGGGSADRQQGDIIILFLFFQRQYMKGLRNNSVVLVRERTIPIERPPLVGEVSANFSV